MGRGCKDRASPPHASRGRVRLVSGECGCPPEELLLRAGAGRVASQPPPAYSKEAAARGVPAAGAWRLFCNWPNGPQPGSLRAGREDSPLPRLWKRGPKGSRLTFLPTLLTFLTWLPTCVNFFLKRKWVLKHFARVITSSLVG